MSENLITDRTVIDVMAFTQCAESIHPTDKFSFEEYARNFINEYDYIKNCNFITCAIIRTSLPYWWYRFTQTDKAPQINWLSNFAIYLSKVYPFTQCHEPVQISAFRAIKEMYGLSFKDSIYKFGFMYPEFMLVYNNCLKN